MIKFYLIQIVIKYCPLIEEIYPNKNYIINLLISVSNYLSQPRKVMIECSKNFDSRLLV